MSYKRGYSGELSWFYQSTAWRKCRSGFIALRKRIDGGMCQVCGEEIGNTVHHKKRLTIQNVNDASISLNHDNLELLCWSCHEKEHGRIRGEVEGRVRLTFDSNGRPVPS